MKRFDYYSGTLSDNSLFHFICGIYCNMHAKKHMVSMSDHSILNIA